MAFYLRFCLEFHCAGCVPDIIWLSKDYQQRYQVDQALPAKTGESTLDYSQDNLFSTMLGFNRRTNDGEITGPQMIFCNRAGD